MNLIRLAMEKAFGKGTSKSAARRREKTERGFAVGTRNNNANSRQSVRAAYMDAEYAKVAVPPDAVGNKRHAIVPRKLRRELARDRAREAYRRSRLNAREVAA